jgi:hypothetical protein
MRIVKHDACRPQPVKDPSKPPRPLVVAGLLGEFLLVTNHTPQGHDFMLGNLDLPPPAVRVHPPT